MEVEQSLGVLDGGVIILDGSAGLNNCFFNFKFQYLKKLNKPMIFTGVEAQTLTVWRQCDTYNLPRIAYINKMDRMDSNIDMCIESMRNKLETTPICLQIPIKDEKLKGLIFFIQYS